MVHVSCNGQEDITVGSGRGKRSNVVSKKLVTDDSVRLTKFHDQKIQ